MNAKVYVMRDASGMVKLGVSANPERRSKQFGRPVDLVHETDVLVEAGKIEHLAHRILALHGKHVRGEWFEAEIGAAIRAIELAIRQAEGQELALGGHFSLVQKPRRRTRIVEEKDDEVVIQDALTPFQMLDVVRKAVEVAGSQRAFAKQVGFSQPYISDVLSGSREVSASLAEKLGYRRRVLFVEKSKPPTLSDTSAA